jgi:hypothetical protein
MDNTWNAPLEIGLYRNHIPSGALSDQCFLQVARVAGIGYDTIQLLLQSLVGHAHVAADTGQLWASLINHFALIIYRAPDLVFQILTWFDASSNVGQKGYLTLKANQDPPHPLRSTEGALNVKQIYNLEDGPPLSVPGLRPNIVHTTQRNTAVGIKQVTSFTGLPQSLLNLGEHGRGFEKPRQFLARREGSVLCQTSQDLGEFQGI